MKRGSVVEKLPSFAKLVYPFGQVENAEVRKPKYGKRKYESERKSRLSLFSPLLTNECVC